MKHKFWSIEHVQVPNGDDAVRLVHHGVVLVIRGKDQLGVLKCTISDIAFAAPTVERTLGDQSISVMDLYFT